MGQRHLAGARVGAAANQTSIGDGVVRRAEGAGRDECLAGRKDARYRMDMGGGECLGQRDIGQDRRQAAGQQRLARAGRANKEQVVL